MRATSISKGLQGVPFVRFFVPFCQAAQEANNDDLMKIFRLNIYDKIKRI